MAETTPAPGVVPPPPSPPPLLRLEGLGKRYGGVRALAEVDLELLAGEVHCLVGENGSGKSTLIKIVSGVVAPEPGGVVAFDGEAAVAGLTPAEAKRRGVQVIFQDLSLFPNLSVAENVAFDTNLARPLGLADRGAQRRIAAEAMARVGLRLDPGEAVGRLPIARRQMVAIARALAAEARLIIMDEPTASLTRTEVDALLRVVRELKAQGLCVVFVSHRLDEVRAVADRVTVLRDGRKVGTFPAAEVDQRRIAFLMTGQAFEERPPEPLPAGRPVVLEAEGLSRAGDFYDVDLKVHAGEVLGITGLLGSGRTELALALFGMNQPERGEIRLEGRPLRLGSNRDAIDEGIAYVSEDRLLLGLVMPQSIAANLALPVLGRLRNGLGLIDRGRRDGTVRRWVGDLKIKVGHVEDPVSSLSGGNQQRVVLAKWMATGPKVLILDSPTVGVDVAAKHGIYQVVADLAARGVAIILISDEIGEVHQHCHRVLVMRQGRIVAEAAPARVSEAELDRAVHA